MVQRRVLVIVDFEKATIVFVTRRQNIISKNTRESMEPYPLNIRTARSASTSLARTTVPNPRERPSGPKATSARTIAPACRKRSFRSCHWQWNGSCERIQCYVDGRNKATHVTNEEISTSIS